MTTQTWLDLHPEYKHWQHHRGEPLVRYVPLAAGVPEDRPTPPPAPVRWRPGAGTTWTWHKAPEPDNEPWS